jgi:exopolysaccharide biosynthesis polyprenyl glycosylphosphotransferase
MNTRIHALNVLPGLSPQASPYLAIKRLVDILAAFCGLLVLSPLLLLTAISISLDSPGNPLFFQTRVGKDGKTFRCWKFRSMYKDAEARKAALLKDNEMAGGVTFKMQNDPRITRIGRVIRKLSIDELPQLWNVLAGDMTLVGPRPPVPQEVAEYTPHQWRRLAVTPGITCIWQVSGRSNIPFPQQVEMDIQYINQRSLWLDLTLLLKTIPAVLTSRGAC